MFLIRHAWREHPEIQAGQGEKRESRLDGSTARRQTGYTVRQKAGDYAGHGSQEQAPPEFWHPEPDRLNETLVCYDNRSAGGWDLADKDLAKLIDEVDAGGAHVVVIFDCCHSESGTRSGELDATAVRRVPTDLRVRPLESFLVGLDEANRLARTRGLAETPTSWPVGRHVLLAACRDNEEASEYSYFLNQALRFATGPLTYCNLFARTDAMPRSAIKTQSPLIEATSTTDLDALFLDGAIRPSAPYFTVAARDGRWILQAGAAHGLPRGEGPETVELALFPFDTPANHLSDLSKAVGWAHDFPPQSPPSGRHSWVACSAASCLRHWESRIVVPILSVLRSDPIQARVTDRSEATQRDRPESQGKQPHKAG